MKRYLALIALLLVVVCPCRSQYDNTNFKLLSNDLKELVLNTQTISKDTVLAIDIDAPIYGLSISGAVAVPNNNSYVRVVLKDTNGKEYLVYETNSILSPTSSSVLSNVGFETLSLDGIVPDSLLLYVVEGNLTLNQLHYVLTTSTQNTRNVTVLNPTEIKTLQAEVIAEQLNENLRSRNKLWRAGLTDIALMSYEEKKALFGNNVPNLQGLEYYKGGIIELSNKNNDYSINQPMLSISEEISNDSLYYLLKTFDWRNKDGINWMTSVKNQILGTCWLFSSIGMVEAAVNIYFDQKIDYNLSEQDVVACGNMHSQVWEGGRPTDALSYIRAHGVVDEACFPWVGTGMTTFCDEKGTTPEDVIYIDYRYDSIPPSLWKEKIHVSPCVLGFSFTDENGYYGHAVVLTGYKEIAIGDTVLNNSLDGNLIVDANNIPNDKTAWIFKNSWGSSWGDDGYGYFTVNGYSNLELWQVTRVTSQIYAHINKDAVDKDGDGYYYWGMGSTPYNLPEWAPLERDGDDNDANYGPVSEKGLLRLSPNLRDTIICNESELWNNSNYIWQHVKIEDGGELDLNNDYFMYKDATITIESGGTLKLSGGYIYQANIIVKEGGTLRIINGGMLKINDSDALTVEKGGILDIQHGSIKLMN